MSLIYGLERVPEKKKKKRKKEYLNYLAIESNSEKINHNYNRFQ